MISKFGNWVIAVVLMTWLGCVWLLTSQNRRFRCSPCLRASVVGVLFALCTLPAFAQGTLMQLPPLTTSLGTPIAGATINVFTTTGNLPSLVCAAPVTVYKDVALTLPFITLTTDGAGNYPFFISPSANPYGLTVSGAGTATSQCYGFSAPVPPLSSPTFLGVTTTTLTVTGNAAIGTLGVTGNASFKGGSPWFDVTSFGAKCDAVTDDTAAIQAAWNAAKAVGSPAFVYFPPKVLDCIAAGTLNFSSSNGIRMGSLGGGTATLSFPRITFTGNTGPLVNCQNSLGLTFQNMAFTYNNAAFVGNVFDCTSGGTSNNIRWENAMVGGTSTAKTAANLILAPGCQKCGVYGSHFGWAVNGINSLVGNVLTVEDSDFGSAAGTLSGTYLVNMTAGSRITGNNFEFINAPNTTSIFDSSSAGCFGCEFSGNWSGDMPAGWTGTLLKGATGGMSIHGNTFQGVAGGTILTINGGQNGLDFTGNSVQGPWGTIFTANGAVSNVNVTGNQYSGVITNFWTGAGNIPSSGIVTDNSGNTTVYGGNLTMSASTFPRLILNAQGGAVDTKNWDILGTSTQLIFRHMNDALNSASNAFVVDNVGNVVSDVAMQVPFDLQEQGAPTLRAGFTRLYADSTSHTLKSSLNGGSLLNIPQVIGSGTATMTTAAITGPNCGTTVTVAATGVLTTDGIIANDNAAPAATTNGPLVIKKWPTAGNVNFAYCVQSGTITPAAATLNWRVIR